MMEQLGTYKGKRFDQFPAWEGQGLPLRENCDPLNPRQALLWMFTAMPGVQGAPLPLPTEYWEMVSWRMWILGARPIRKPQLKYQPPQNAVADRWSASGQWVTLCTPDLPRKSLAEVVSVLPQADRAELKNIVLDQLGLDGTGLPPTPAGHMTVRELAGRLDVEGDRLVQILQDFGMPADPDSFVDREVGERIAAHLGL
ncbi:DUF2744 domain-containing protein [Rhodococcus hoagii]|nr:DUF2744 domain-containing protein [Prescottella equi]NKS42548.1 DUF2744 domain-containing protein [Prescottella equi]